MQPPDVVPVQRQMPADHADDVADSRVTNNVMEPSEESILTLDTRTWIGHKRDLSEATTVVNAPSRKIGQTSLVIEEFPRDNFDLSIGLEGDLNSGLPTIKSTRLRRLQSLNDLKGRYSLDNTNSRGVSNIEIEENVASESASKAWEDVVELQEAKKEVEAKPVAEEPCVGSQDAITPNHWQVSFTTTAHQDLQPCLDDLNAQHESTVKELHRKNQLITGKDQEIIRLRARIHDTTKDLFEGHDNYGQAVNDRTNIIDNQHKENRRLLRVISSMQTKQNALTHEAQASTMHGSPSHAAYKKVIAQRDDLEQQLDQAKQGNILLADAVAKAREEAEFYMAKTWNLGHVLENKLGAPEDVERLLEYREKQLCVQEKRADESAEVCADLERQLQKRKDLSNAEITSLKREVEDQQIAIGSLKDMKDTFQQSNERILDMLLHRLNATRFVSALSEYYEIVKQDNSILAAKVIELESKTTEADKLSTKWEKRYRDLFEGLSSKADEMEKLEAVTRGLETEIGRYKVENEVHNEDLANRDSTITDLNQQIEDLTKVLTSLKEMPHSEQVQWQFDRKEQDMARLQEMYDGACTTLSEYQYRDQLRGHFKRIDVEAEVWHLENDRLIESRMITAEAEVNDLRQRLDECNPAQVRMAIEYREDLRVAQAKVQELSEKLEAEFAQSLDDMETQKRMREHADTKIEMLENLAGNLWYRMRQLEETLKLHGRVIVEDGRDRAELLAICEQVLGLTDDVVEAGGSEAAVGETPADDRSERSTIILDQGEIQDDVDRVHQGTNEVYTLQEQNLGVQEVQSNSGAIYEARDLVDVPSSHEYNSEPAHGYRAPIETVLVSDVDHNDYGNDDGREDENPDSPTIRIQQTVDRASRGPVSQLDLLGDSGSFVGSEDGEIEEDQHMSVMHTTPQSTRTEDSLVITSSAWARKYTPFRCIEPSNDEIF